MKKRLSAFGRGFTLIELLVTITIIGVLAALITANLSDARARARDAKIKQNLVQLKTALRLYYNDYQTYPAQATFGLCGSGRMNSIKGCGAAGDECCPKTGCSVDFAAGGDGCDTATIYMNKFPAGLGNNTVAYYPVASGEKFCLTVMLENPSDPDILASQAGCASPCTGYYTAGTAKYLVCAD